MKTKKTSKILSVVLTLAILVCSLSAVLGFVTTAETNPEETELIDNLKTAWQAMYTETKIANLKTDKLVQNFVTVVDVSTAGLTFNSDNTVNKTAVEYDDKNIGIIFQNSAAGSSFWFDNGANNRGPQYADVFNDNNYDALRVTFKTGTVTASGTAYLLCTYSDYNSTKSAEIDITAGDNGKTVNLDAKTLFGKNLSELMKNKELDLTLFKVGFSKGLAFEGAELSGLYALKYATLPANSEDFTTALQWYNEAKDLDVSGYKNTAAFNTALKDLKTYLSKNDPNFMVSELKTAWQSLYTKSSIADFNTDKFMMNQIDGGNYIDYDPYGKAFTFNKDGSFNKSPTGQTTYHFGLVFNVKAGERFTSALSAFNNAFNNNDSLYFTFNPGTVNANGNLLVILQYYGWDGENQLYANVPVEKGDKIEIEKLTYKCANATKFPDKYTFTKPSDMLTSPANGNNLFTIKIMFDATANVSNATVSSLQGANYAVLPEGSFTALDWYDKAKKLNISGYENTDAFNTALNNLETYLSANDPNFVVYELKESWGKLSKDVSVAKLKTDVLVNQMSGDNTKTLAGVGLTFNENNKFNKSAYDPNYVGGTYYLYGLVFSKKNSTGDNVFFDSNLNSSDNNAFNSAFSDDSLYFTFNPGTVTKPGKMWVLLQYNDYSYENVLYSPVEIKTTDSNTPIRIDINKCTFHSAKNDAVIDHTHLSDLLKYTNPADKEVSLYTMKVFFDPYLVTEGSSISELKTVKTETVPSDTDNELISGKSLRVDTDFYEGIAQSNFVANRDKFYNNLMTGKVRGDVTGNDGIDIRDLVALKKLGYENDETYKLIADMNKDGYITKDDTTVLRSQILNS